MPAMAQETLMPKSEPLEQIVKPPQQVPVPVPVAAGPVPFPSRWSNLAQSCLDIHGLDPHAWEKLNNTRLHIVYFAWLPNNKNAMEIIPGQMAEVEASGLLDRPNTQLHVIISTTDESQRDWMLGLDFMKRYKPIVTHNKRNTYEFPGIRYLWEIGCKNPNDFFLYFHNKGARYGKGRIGMEKVLTRELVVAWRQMLSFSIYDKGSYTFGLGGPAYQWMNFFYMRGSFFPMVPKPVVVPNRYWYEEWAGYDVTLGDHSKPADFYSQCHLATGMQNALEEPSTSEPKAPRRSPQYGIIRCGSLALDGGNLDKWSIPVAERMERMESMNKP